LIPICLFRRLGTCLVLQTSGDASYGKTFPGALPAGASLSPQPNQIYNNGMQTLPFTPALPYFSSVLGGMDRLSRRR
jgi:hypothetical protein